jgi:hypothetical protein
VPAVAGQHHGKGQRPCMLHPTPEYAASPNRDQLPNPALPAPHAPMATDARSAPLAASTRRWVLKIDKAELPREAGVDQERRTTTPLHCYSARTVDVRIRDVRRLACGGMQAGLQRGGVGFPLAVGRWD